MAETSTLNCLSSRVPYQSLHSLNALPSFSEKALLFTAFCFVASPSPNPAPTHQQEASITWFDLFRPKIHPKTPGIITPHGVLEPVKQALLALRDVMSVPQVAALTCRGFVTSGDGLQLPTLSWKSEEGWGGSYPRRWWGVHRGWEVERIKVTRKWLLGSHRGVTQSDSKVTFKWLWSGPSQRNLIKKGTAARRPTEVPPMDRLSLSAGVGGAELLQQGGGGFN